MGPVNALAQAGGEARPSAWVWVSRERAEAFAAFAAFAVLCVVVLRVGSRLVEPDDYAYRASIVAITQGHFLTLSTAQFARFYVPAAGAIALLGSWLATRLPRRASLAAATSAAVAVTMFGLGAWSFASMREFQLGGFGRDRLARRRSLRRADSQAPGRKRSRGSFHRAPKHLPSELAVTWERR